jgi:hypothetical protein
VSDEFDDPTDPVDDETVQLQTFYPNVVEWVDEWLLPRYARSLKTHRWDPQWFEYVEVVDRLEALWRAWEHFRLEGMTGMAVFFRDYLDPAMGVITSPDGPFWNLGNLGPRSRPEPWSSGTPDSDFYASL